MHKLLTLRTFKKRFYKEKPKNVTYENWLMKIGFYMYGKISIKNVKKINGRYDYQSKVYEFTKELFSNSYNMLVVYFLIDESSYNKLREFTDIYVYYTTNEDILNEIDNSR